MSHQAVRDFLRDSVLNIRDDITFSYARETDFNTLPNKAFPAVLLKPLRFEPERNAYTVNRRYKVTMIFYMLDSMQGQEFETQDILDKTDVLLGQFLAKLNLKNFTEDPEETLNTDTIEIENEGVTERIKMTVDNMTGWEYSFDLLVPDQFSYCKIYD